MDNITIAIVSDDAEYNRALSRSIVSVSRDIEVTVFGSMQFVSSWSEYQGRVPYYETFDIVLWSGEEVSGVYGDNIVFLTDKKSDAGLDYSNNRFALYKYSSGRSIASAAFDIYSHLSGHSTLKLKNGDMRIIGFASFSGGAGCTTIAMAAGRELCRFRNRKVLYLSMEDVESTEEYLQDTNGAKTIGEYLYRLLGKRAGLPGRSKEIPFPDGFLIKDMFGLEGFRPSGARNPLRELSEDEMDMFLGAMTGCGRFDTILIDFGSCLTEAAMTAMKEAESICLISKSDSQQSRRRNYLNQISCVEDVNGKIIQVMNTWDEGKLEGEVEGIVDMLLAR